jgi:hypothetical protein
MNPCLAKPKASTSLIRQSAPLSTPQCSNTPLLRRQRPVIKAQAGGGSDFQTPPPDDEGDAGVQDALVNMLKFQIGKKEVEEYVEESGDRLKELADEAKEEMERLAELTKMRGDVAFDSALADINKEADEFTEQLRRSREEQAEKDAEFNDWEVDMNAARSEGQFFKNLYQTDKKRPVGDSAEMLKRRAQRVIEPARQEISSPIRFYLFLVLAFLLAADVGADLASSEPSIGPDLLYSALAALAVWLAINEKEALK